MNHKHVFVCVLVSPHRPICLTSKCMRTSPPSLRPPRSGAAVRGFAAAVSCYDVKTTAPLPLSPCPSYTVPAARHLTHHDPLSTPMPAPLSKSTCWCVPFWSCRERERAKQRHRVLGNSPKNIPNSSHHKHALQLPSTRADTQTHLDTERNSQKNVTTFLGCVQRTNQYYKEGYVKNQSWFPSLSSHAEQNCSKNNTTISSHQKIIVQYLQAARLFSYLALWDKLQRQLSSRIFK